MTILLEDHETHRELARVSAALAESRSAHASAAAEATKLAKQVEELKADLADAECRAVAAAESALVERDQLRRELPQYDCQRTGGPASDVGGAHCPLGQPCMRCRLEVERDALESELTKARAFGDAECALRQQAQADLAVAQRGCQALRAELEEAREQVAQHYRSFDGHVYIKSDDYSALCRERDTARAEAARLRAFVEAVAEYAEYTDDCEVAESSVARDALAGVLSRLEARARAALAAQPVGGGHE
jgi:hypothetical protein